MLAPGHTFERYTVEAVIGQGGMAVVYRVRHNQLGSLHALKILTVPKPHIRERLLQEGRAQAVIRHPNVVSVTDVVEIENSPALLMEFVDGPTLEEWLENEEPTLEIAEELFRGICLGVGEAHAHGLVHRDLKPANVLLQIGRNGIVPKVTDFGIAKVLASDEPNGSTRTNIAMGTPHYMAPEQIRDAKTVDQRADIFSLGCILYELVTGEKPFNGPDVLTVLNSVATGRYANPRKHVPELPDRIVQAIEGALRVDRDNRIQDCVSLLSVALGMPVSANPTWSSRADVVLPSKPPWGTGEWNLRGSAAPALHGPTPTLEMQGRALSSPTPASEAPTPAPAMSQMRVPTDPGPAPDANGNRPGRGSWFDDDHQPAMRIATDTPSPPVDPNARTVPSVQRTEGPRSTADRVQERVFVVVAALAIVSAVTAILVIAVIGPVGSPLPADDELVMGVAGQTPPSTITVPDAAPTAATDDAATSSARPSSSKPRVATGDVTHATSSAATKPQGGFLFGAGTPLPPGQGSVAVTGDVHDVKLLGDQWSFVPGPVPKGHYKLQAGLGNKDPKVVMELDVDAGQAVHVDCPSPKGCTVVP